MTKKEVLSLFKELRKIFDIVRLVDSTINVEYSVNDNGEILAEPYKCYSVWNKGSRCENCVSAKAFIKKSKLTKFEFIDKEAYFVVAMYIEVDECPYILEMVSKVSDETLFGAYGRDKFMQTISEHNRKMYIDSLTGAYNRLYYEEQIIGLHNISAVAMADVDDFKEINDKFGHMAGDAALKEIVRVMFENIEENDAVVRYGGDEFIIVYKSKKIKDINEKLERIRKNIFNISIKGYPELRLSVSIGCVFSNNITINQIDEVDKMLYKAKKIKNTVLLKKD